jgi:hypothetical protein
MTRDPRIKTELNRLTHELRTAILEIKQQSVEAYLQALTDDGSTDYALWKATRRFKRPTLHIPPVRKHDSKWARNNKEKAETFADHLEKTFQPHEKRTMDNLQRIEEAQNQTIPPTTPKEILIAIKNINPKKAPGFDLIKGQILKQLPHKAVVKVTHLYNAAFRLIYMHSYWKAAEVIMLLKPEKPATEVTSYRPISLLPVLSNLFEKLLLKRLKPIIEKSRLYRIISLAFGTNTQLEIRYIG